MDQTLCVFKSAWEVKRFNASKSARNAARKLIYASLSLQIGKQTNDLRLRNIEIRQEIQRHDSLLVRYQEKLQILDSMIDLASQSVELYFEKRMENLCNNITKKWGEIRGIINEEAEHWKEIHSMMNQKLLIPGDMRSSRNLPRTVQQSPAEDLHIIDEEEEEQQQSTDVPELLNATSLTPLLTRAIRKTRLQSKIVVTPVASSSTSINLEENKQQQEQQQLHVLSAVQLESETNRDVEMTKHSLDILNSKEERMSVVIPPTPLLSITDKTFVVKKQIEDDDYEQQQQVIDLHKQDGTYRAETEHRSSLISNEDENLSLRPKQLNFTETDTIKNDTTLQQMNTTKHTSINENTSTNTLVEQQTQIKKDSTLTDREINEIKNNYSVSTHVPIVDEIEYESDSADVESIEVNTKQRSTLKKRDNQFGKTFIVPNIKIEEFTIDNSDDESDIRRPTISDEQYKTILAKPSVFIPFSSDTTPFEQISNTEYFNDKDQISNNQKSDDESQRSEKQVIKRKAGRPKRNETHLPTKTTTTERKNPRRPRQILKELDNNEKVTKTMKGQRRGGRKRVASEDTSSSDTKARKRKQTGSDDDNIPSSKKRTHSPTPKKYTLQRTNIEEEIVNIFKLPPLPPISDPRIHYSTRFSTRRQTLAPQVHNENLLHGISSSARRKQNKSPINLKSTLKENKLNLDENDSNDEHSKRKIIKKKSSSKTKKLKKTRK